MARRVRVWFDKLFKGEEPEQENPFRTNRSQFLERENPRARGVIRDTRKSLEEESENLDLTFEEVDEQDPDATKMDVPLSIPYESLPGRTVVRRKGDVWYIQTQDEHHDKEENSDILT